MGEAGGKEAGGKEAGGKEAGVKTFGGVNSFDTNSSINEDNTFSLYKVATHLS